MSCESSVSISTVMPEDILPSCIIDTQIEALSPSDSEYDGDSNCRLVSAHTVKIAKVQVLWLTGVVYKPAEIFFVG